MASKNILNDRKVTQLRYVIITTDGSVIHQTKKIKNTKKTLINYYKKEKKKSAEEDYSIKRLFTTQGKKKSLDSFFFFALRMQLLIPN